MGVLFHNHMCVRVPASDKPIPKVIGNKLNKFSFRPTLIEHFDGRFQSLVSNFKNIFVASCGATLVPLGPEVACEVGVLFWGLLPGAADGAAGGGA